MKFLKFNLKTFNLALFCGLVCAVLLSLADFDASCNELRENVLRLHIIANSDSETDQALKLKVRDEILTQSGELFESSENISDAVIRTNEALPIIEQTVNSCLLKYGAEYTGSATVKDTYFETREYDTFTLPAGTYNSLVVTLGEGEGKNWWCVIFPEVCLPLGNTDFTDTTTEKTAEIAENPSEYKMRFKIVEIYEDIKRFFR